MMPAVHQITSVCALCVGFLLSAALRAEPDIEISWLGPPRFDGARQGSWIQRRIEERFGVTLRPVFISWFSYDRRLPLMMLGGETPDVLWVQDTREARRNAAHRLTAEVPYELVARHAPNYLRMVQELAPDAWLLTRHDGRNIGLPLLGSYFSQRHPIPGIWRMDWLRKVGFDAVPETLEEWGEALYRFRHADPDGNGRQDTYGWLPDRAQASPFSYDPSFQEVFGAFGLLQTGWVKREGRLRWGGVLPETKRALAVLRQWYADGLIYPDYLVIPAGTIDRERRFTSGEVGYVDGFGSPRTFGFRHPKSPLHPLHLATPSAELAPAVPPRGPNGQRGVRVLGGVVEILQFGHHLERDRAKLVRVLEMFEAWASDEELYLECRLAGC